MSDRNAYTVNVGGRLISLSSPVVMGILNATPDSFFAGSRVQTEEAVARRTDEIIAEGAAIIDVGACSTRPGGCLVSEDEEMARLRIALRVVRSCQPAAVVSIDTFRPMVARMAVEEFGPVIINDVGQGAGTMATLPLPPDEVPPMFDMVARLRVPYVLMSAEADIHAMLLSLSRQVQMLHALGVPDIIIDPGFGFGKTMEQNYQVMAHLERLQALRRPVLVGVSRKSMVTRLLGCDADGALNGTTALHAVALMKGAAVLRAHDVAAAVEVVRITKQIYDN